MSTPAILGDREPGKSVPPDTEHAISFSIPTWQIIVDRDIEEVETGYPRFFMHRKLEELDIIVRKSFGREGESCILVCSAKVALEAEAFIRHQAMLAGVPATLRHVHYTIEDSSPQKRPGAQVYIIFYPESMQNFVMELWQNTGLIISSRFAEYCLSLLPEELKVTAPQETSKQEHSTVTRNEGRSGGLSGPLAKKVLRNRIARAITTGKVDAGLNELCDDMPGIGTGQHPGVQEVGERDVFLYPGGMAAIWNTYNLCLRARRPAKSVIFGMPYADTLEVLQRWGPGAHFYGFGNESDWRTLEHFLEEESRKDPTTPPILALFTELPSNPLLRSPDLPRLRALADTYDFLLVIDDTLGNFVNVEVLPYADMVITSLTKIFSGAANVMGGSLVLNPKGRHYKTLVSKMADYEDIYYDGDAVVMERNSRDLVQRVRIIDANAETLCAYLHARSVAGGAPSAVIKEVFYPKYINTQHYMRCKRPGGGFGGLFSLTFTTLAASKAFFDALACYKGPTVGTNFTLALPYTIFVYPERQKIAWAESYGMPEGLVRVSVGMEDKDLIMRAFSLALKAAEATQPTYSVPCRAKI